MQRKDVPPHAGMERLADGLLSGQTENIHRWLEIAGGQEHLKDEAMTLMARVRTYEKEYGIAEPVRKESVRGQLANAKKQVTVEKGSKPHRKCEMGNKDKKYMNGGNDRWQR